MSQRIRIGFFSSELYCGGAEWWVIQLMNALDPDKFEIVGVGIHSEKGELGDAYLLEKVRQRTSIGRGGDHLKQLSCSCDLILCWNTEDPFYYFDPSSRAKVVFVSHASDPRLCVKWRGLERAAGLVAVSDQGRRTFPPSLQPSVHIIPNTVGTERMEVTIPRHRLVADLGIAEDSKVLLMVGRVAVEKRYWLLLDTLACLPADWCGVHVGDGKEGIYDDFVEAAERLVPGRCRFLRNRFDVGNFLTASTVFLLPSATESFSLALLEALYMGATAVATPVGICEDPKYREVVHMLSPAPSGKQIAKRILSLDPEDQLRRSLRGQELVKQKMPEFSREWNRYLVSLVHSRRNHLLSI